MSEASSLPPVEIKVDQPLRSKFERERQAFFRLFPQLLKTHAGQYVAIHEERIADCGTNRLDVAMRVLRRVGSVDIFVGLVTDRAEPISRSGVRRELGLQNLNS